VDVQANVVVPVSGIVASLVEMGFPLEACKKAAFNTNNAGTTFSSNLNSREVPDRVAKFFLVLQTKGGNAPKGATKVPNGQKIVIPKGD
jgi:hypothetical protein